MDDFQERTFGGLTVRIDRTLCIGSGSCVNAAPEVWELGADRIVRFKEDASEAVERDRLVESCRVCPVDALLAYNERGEEVAP